MGNVNCVLQNYFGALTNFAVNFYFRIDFSRYQLLIGKVCRYNWELVFLSHLQEARLYTEKNTGRAPIYQINEAVRILKDP